jgi:hypothetical protein
MFFLVLSGKSNADTFYVPDTTFTMGQTYLLPVYGVISDSGEVTLEITYSAATFDVKDIVCADSSAFECLETKDISVNDYKNSKITITGIAKNINSNILCYLQIEPLVCSQASGKIESTSMLVAGNKPERFRPWKAIINLKELVLPKDVTFLSQARPNPFREFLEFNIGLIEDSKVSFYIYSANGELIQKIPGNQQAFSFSLNAADTFDGTLPKGNYTLKLMPNRDLVPLGLYVIFMDTGKKIYKSNFIFMK